MKNIYIIILLCLISLWSCNPKSANMVKEVPETDNLNWRSQAPKSGEAKPVQMGKYTESTLSNGMKLIIVENHKLPLVNFQVSLNSPPISELDGGMDKTGYVGLAGGLMASGTTSRTKSEIDQGIDNLGASLSTRGRSASGQCLTKHVDSFLEIFSDVLMNPSFTVDEYDKAVKRTISGIQSNQDDPNAIAGSVRNRLVFGDQHPYGKSATISSINNVVLDDIKNYHSSTWYPENIYLIIVGDLTPEEAKEKAEKYFGPWENPKMMPGYAPMPPAVKVAERKVNFVNKAGAVQSVINIAYPLNIKPGDDDAIKASLMNAILGGGVFSSKLMQNLREDKAYTYGARSTLDVDPYQGYFNAFASVRNEVTDSSIVEFLKEMNVMRSNMVNDENLNIAKKFMTGTFARSLSNPGTVARLALNTAKYNLPDNYYENYIANIQKVSKDDVLEMAKKYIRPDAAHIIVVGNKKEVSQKLLAFDQDGTIDYYDTEGNYIEPIVESIPEGHTAEIVLKDFVDAIGGEKAINNVQDMTTVYKADVMGQNIDFKSVYKAPGMTLEEVRSGSMVLEKTIFDGKILKMSSMQGNKEFTEGKEFEVKKEGAVVISQMNYFKPIYSMTLDGIDQVNGQSHYVLLIKKPNGESITEYYNKETSLLSKVVESTVAQGQNITVIRELSDYKEYGGIMIPSKVSMTGMLPTPVVLNLAEAKINSGVEEELFK